MKLRQVAGVTMLRASLSTSGYSIGKPGVPWGAIERATWLSLRKTSRSYQEEVVRKISSLKECFDVIQYGALSYDVEKFPLFAIKSRDWNPEKPNVLVTGGVHGYETSGVHGALLFLETKAAFYSNKFNIVVAPCVSPWSYETIQRWNAASLDPNRSFGKDSHPQAEESLALMRFIESLNIDQWLCHVDLHETTDTDETEFRPAKAARDGVAYEPDTIPGLLLTHPTNILKE